jgi:hypothetical protein
MRLARAALARRGTAEIPDQIREDVPIGATYIVDLDSIRRQVWKDARTGAISYPLAVYCCDDAKHTFGWFQIDLLDIDEGEFLAEKAA